MLPPARLRGVPGRSLRGMHRLRGNYTAILGNPKQRHSAFYAPDGRLAGRKFYYHHRRTNF